MDEDIIDVIRKELGRRYVTYKPEEITWDEWYDFWKERSIDPIGQELKLPPHEEMIRIITQEGKVYYGSEKFITLDLALERAFRSGDEDLVNYFMDLIPKRGYFNDRYNNTIIAAIENGYDEEALKIIGERNVDLNKDVVITLGKYNLRNFYVEKILPKLLSRRNDLNYWEKFYRYGLIEGRHNKEVLPFLPELKNKAYRYAFQGSNYEVINRLENKDEEFIKEALLAGYYNKDDLKAIELKKYVAQLIPKYPEVALRELEKNRDTLFKVNKTCYYPLLDYALHNNLLIIPDYKSCQADLIEKYLAHPLYPKERAVREFYSAIVSGREDLAVLLLPYITSYKKGLETVLIGSYKDIFLYFIRKLIKRNKSKKETFLADALNIDEYQDDDNNPELLEYLSLLGEKQIGSFEASSSLELLMLDY